MEELYAVQNGKIKTIVLNRPAKLNAFTRAMEEELMSILHETMADPSTSVVVIKGVGRSFSAGHDLNEAYENAEPYAIATKTGDERRRGFRHLENWLSLLWELPQPVIAQVHGHCYNYALELAMNCDFVFASADARFVHRPVGGSARLFHLWPWLIGPRRAKEYQMLGEAIVGTEAERIGLINRAVPEEELDATVEDFASRLSRVPLEFLALDKKAVNVCMEMQNLRPALGYTMELHALSHLTDASQALAQQMTSGGWKAAWAERDRARASSGEPS